MRFLKRARKSGAVHTAEMTRATEASNQSRVQAREDLSRQRELLAHENRTVTAPLREERVAVNHFSTLIRDALQAGYENRHRGEPA